MTTFNTEFRTKFEMETDTGELFDVLEHKAQAAFLDVFGNDDDLFEIEPSIYKVRGYRVSQE